MNKFRVNRYITLKLENNKTIIYVDGENFDQCKFLLLNIPVENYKEFTDVESVDEASEKLDGKLENGRIEGISPETEFWAHCSNLQVWAENKYNTRLLHRSIAFPLLKRLTELGDHFAKIRLREEIIKRFESGYPPVVEYLINGGYLKYFSKAEYYSYLLNSEEERKALDDLRIIAKNTYSNNFKIVRDMDFLDENRERSPGFFITIQDRHVIGLDIHCNQLEEFPKAILKLRCLKKLYLDYNNISIIPNDIGCLTSLVDLSMKCNKLSYLPRSIGKLRSLKNLGLEHNELKSVPNELVESCPLEYVYLGYHVLNKIPESISKLKNLKQLQLEYNKLT